MAVHVSSRSTCLRRQVGAVAVRDNRVLACGYNGSPTGAEHCEVSGCLRENLNVASGERHELCRAVHAEQNIVAQAARFGIPLEGATLYSTTYPCSLCAKLLVQVGIRQIVFIHGYPDTMTHPILSCAGIEVIKA